MLKSVALVVPLFATACLGDPSYPPQAAPPTTPIAFTQLEVAHHPIVVATGGVQVITIPDPNSIGWSGRRDANLLPTSQ